MKLDAMRLEVENHEASDFENWAIVDADSDNGDVVALVPKTDDVERPELAIANLFAAAPELLAALQAVEKRLTDCANAFYGAGTTKALRAAFDGWKADIAPARAAIAKATGNV